MKHFLRRCILWILGLVIPLETAFYVKGVIPYVSNNESINYKLFKSSQTVRDSLEMIAIGNSITLNNLYSPTIAQEITPRYYNFACAGLDIKSIKFMAEFYLNKYYYKKVIILSQPLSYGQDFTFPSKWEFEMIYQHHYHLVSFLSPFKSMGIGRSPISTDPKEIHNQAYDPWGSAYLQIDHETADPKAWNAAYKPFDHSKTYPILEELCQYLSDRGVHLIFVTTPVKNGYVTTPDALTDYLTDIQKCECIISSYGHTYINFFQNEQFDETHFADIIHMNEKGAQLLTQLLCEKLKTEEE